jgi:hypothetical protein
MNIKTVNIKTVFLGSGLVTAGLGLLILLGRGSTQELDGLMLLLIGVVFLSGAGVIEAISISQKETREMLENLFQGNPTNAVEQFRRNINLA